MRLFRVDCEGAVYWILGDDGTPTEMAAAIEEPEARASMCDAGSPDAVDMWTAAQAHARTGTGRVVACSEWP